MKGDILVILAIIIDFGEKFCYLAYVDSLTFVRGIWCVGLQEIRPWTHMMELPQLHGLGPAASRLLDSYQLLLQLLYNLKSLRESHVAVAMGTEGICEDDVASVTPEQALLGNLVTECEQALIVLNSGLSVLAASQARVLSEPSEVKALIYGKPSLSQRRTRAYKISFVHGPFPSGKRTLKRIRKPVKNLFNLVVCTCLKCAAKTLK